MFFDIKINAVDDILRNVNVLIGADPVTWAFVIANVRFALRHPENNAPTAKIAKAFCDQAIAALRTIQQSPELDPDERSQIADLLRGLAEGTVQ
jgi:hypothetical protein